MSARPARTWAPVGLALVGVLLGAWCWLGPVAAEPVDTPSAAGLATRGGGASREARAAEQRAARSDGGREFAGRAASEPAALDTRRAAEPVEPTIPALGRSASLRVALSRHGLPVSATLEFLAGPDAGRVARVDASGFLELDELHPGLARLELRVADGARCVREVLLRHRRAADLQLDFGPHGVVTGRVLDAAGAPLPGARLALDDVEVLGDADGAFVLQRRVAGGGELVVRHAGFATQRVVLPDVEVAARGAAPPLAITLQPAAELVLRVPRDPRWSGEVQLVLVPSAEAAALGASDLRSSYPWGAIGSLRVPVGGELRLDDLPRCRVDVLAFHPLARGRPLSGWCRPGVPATLDVEFEPAPALELTVLRDGAPVPDARVELFVANRASERARALGEQRGVLDRLPVGRLPHTAQTARTDAQGRARLGLGEETVHLRIRDAAGGRAVVRAVERGRRALSVDLARPDS